MTKTLTISIAAYNSENTIRKTLNSLMNERIIDDLEIFIIDDGGADKTLEIAQEYAEKYPDSVYPIHKENGGYGSTVNYSIAHASGKYFKLLDGDDWFSFEHLESYISLLKKIETDILVLPYYKCADNKEPVISQTVQDETLGMDLQISQLKNNKVFGMWALTFKTLLLKQSDINLPLHCLYTDQIYSIFPFSIAETIRFEDCALYCYHIDQEGQSISRTSRILHIKDNMKVVNNILDFYKKQKVEKCKNIQYIFRRTIAYTTRIFKTFLLEPMSKKVIQNISEYDHMLKEKSPDIYDALGEISFNHKFALYLKLLRISNYGEIGLLVGKFCFSKNGIDNWA